MTNSQLTMSAKTVALKRCIDQTFQLTDMAALQGLSDNLKSIGQQSTAFALEQLIDSEIGLRSEKPETSSSSTQSGSAFSVDKSSPN